jgi:hypothetical protein
MPNSLANSASVIDLNRRCFFKLFIVPLVTGENNHKSNFHQEVTLVSLLHFK